MVSDLKLNGNALRSEQAALKKLVANWRALIDRRLAASEGTLFDLGRK